VRCTQTSRDASEQRQVSSGGAPIHVAPQRFAFGRLYSPQTVHLCKFVNPPPYQHRAASSPSDAAMGNGSTVLYANVLLVSGQKAWHRCGPKVQPALSASNQCCLTRRSTGPATAGGVSLARSGFATVARQAYTACLRGPVSSNVRHHSHLPTPWSRLHSSLLSLWASSS